MSNYRSKQKYIMNRILSWFAYKLEIAINKWRRVKQNRIHQGYISVANNNLLLTRKSWENLRDHNIVGYDEFYNVSLFSAIVARDIRILTTKYLLTNKDHERNLYGRLLGMTLIEFLDDINMLLGKRLREELNSNEMSDFIHEVGDLNKEFSSIKNAHNFELRKIRNSATAHKTKVATDLMELTNNRNYLQTIKISNEVTKVNIKLIKLSTRIIYKITDHIETGKIPLP